MTTASIILDEIASAAGWDVDSQLILALRFIDSQTKVGFLEEWQQFLEEQCQEEHAASFQFIKEFLNDTISTETD